MMLVQAEAFKLARKALAGDTKLYHIDSSEEDMMVRVLAKSAKIIGDIRD
jgi:hypothetical protein